MARFSALANGQPILCRREKDTWFPGHVMLRVPTASGENSNETNDSVQYNVILDAAFGSKTAETCMVSPDSLALASSAADLKQKYPVGARVVCE